jgi:hypothetical protein
LIRGSDFGLLIFSGHSVPSLRLFLARSHVCRLWLRPRRRENLSIQDKTNRLAEAAENVGMTKRALLRQIFQQVGHIDLSCTMCCGRRPTIGVPTKHPPNFRAGSVHADKIATEKKIPQVRLLLQNQTERSRKTLVA